MAIILGVDPGSRTTGYGVIRVEGRHIEYIDSGCIRVGEKPMAERLARLRQECDSLFKDRRAAPSDGRASTAGALALAPTPTIR